MSTILRSLLLPCLLVLTLCSLGQKPDPALIKANVEVLAADTLQGRKPGTKGCNTAAEIIRKSFEQAGLSFPETGAFQDFFVTTDIHTGSNNQFSINDTMYTLDKDYRPFSFSANEAVNAWVVFAGYGFSIDQDSLQWDDYKDVDVKGKWVLVFRGNPEPDNEKSVFLPYSKERSKVLTAKDHGAAGVLFVTGKTWDKNDELVNLSYDKSKSGSGIPVIHIKRALADKILAVKKLKIEELEKEINTQRKPQSVLLQTVVYANTDLGQTSVQTRNVIGYLPGSDPLLKEQFIVVGAHYDHLGLGGPGSGSRFPDSLAVHNGADDNASGTAAVMELARLLGKSGKPLKRTVVFVAFSAEEMGLLGSSWFVEHPLFPMKKADLMLNFDMVGRMNKKNPAISIGGTGTFEGADSLLNKLMEKRSFKAGYSPEGYGPSDHAPFYADSVPVLYFNTGVHTDYHTPSDDAALINYNGIAEVTSLALDILRKVDETPGKLVFREAGPTEKISRGGPLKVRLGIMPDFVNTEIKGVGVGGVTAGGPAEHAGILKGDIITALNGKPVNNIYEYMDRLKTFVSGQTISVDITRNKKNIVLLIQL